jgi:hypothetical protein
MGDFSWHLSCPLVRNYDVFVAIPDPIIHFPERKGNPIAGLAFRGEFSTYQDVHLARLLGLPSESPENPKLTT